MFAARAVRPIGSKFVSSSLPRLVRARYSTELPSYEFIKVSEPKPGVGLSKEALRLVLFDCLVDYGLTLPS
jgi:hypothetical protein